MIFIKKYILISFVLSLILSFSCFAVSPETVPFSQHMRMAYITVNGLTNGVDYTRSVQYDQTGDTFESAVYATNAGTKTYKSWITNFYHIDSNGNVAGMLYDDFITFKLRFRMTGDFTQSKISRAGVYVRKPGVNSDFNWSQHFRVGDITISEPRNGYVDCIANVSFHNTFGQINELRFFLAFTCETSVTFNQNIEVFSGYLYDYYLGSYAGAPDLPKYENPGNTIGNDANDLKDKEDALMNDTAAGRDATIDLFSGLGDVISNFAVPLLAIKSLFDYLVGDTIFEFLLLISLTLGLLSFVFNIFPSIQARQNRQRRAEARNSKNSNNGGG